jgi:predicted acylesterase/phospholipase RssA
MSDPSGPRFSNPMKVCDIVLKGGITSGVVYPLALVSLAEEYRFAKIGGTSAGAIAAAAAAAAEYGRHTETAGFHRLTQVPNEIGPDLLSLFQPTPTLKPLFDILVASLRAKTPFHKATTIVRSLFDSYWRSALLGASAGLLIIVAALIFGGGAGFVGLGLLAAVIGAVIAIIVRLIQAIRIDLPKNDFGICTGIRQAGFSREAFTDWLARLIDEAAGRKSGQDAPLTFGELARPPQNHPPIELAMMTTSLMERRPYTLPMTNRQFVFEKAEWGKLFPAHIMTFLTERCDRFEPQAGESGEYYYFPDADRLPLIVGARMSLSFPGLITAVPLWRRDFTFAEDSERNKLRRCLFSDGGLSSNFPIHFFDRLLPTSPTFAISLDEFDPRRNVEGNVWLPESAGGGIELPVRPFEGVLGFLMRLLDSAKDWQDNLQSTLPGYRERIVHVALKPDEGGLNLAMEEDTIRKLVGYGEEAAQTLRAKFDFDAHRWRRFLVAMARMEETLDDVATAYEDVSQGTEPFADFLARYAEDPDHYKQDRATLAAILARGKELAANGDNWRTAPTIRGGRIPKPATNLRISPKP